MVKKKERAKEIRVNAKARSLKEMFIGGGIDKHDLGIKMKKVIEFLSDGHPVRIFVTAKKLRLKVEPFCVEETTMKVLEAVEDHVQSVQQPESATSSRKDFTLNPKIKKVESPSHKKKIKNSEGNNNDKKENENENENGKEIKMDNIQSVVESNMSGRIAKAIDGDEVKKILMNNKNSNNNININNDDNDDDNDNDDENDDDDDEDSISSHLRRMEAEEEEEEVEEEEEEDVVKRKR